MNEAKQDAPGDTSARIYIGRLNKAADAKQIEELCSTYGRVHHVNIKTGFAFVDFESCKVAKDAAHHLNNATFLNDKIVVEIAKGRPKQEPKPAEYLFPRTQHRLIAENLHVGISWQTLKDHIRKASQPVYCEVVNGNGIIEFSNYNDMIYALRKLDQSVILGHRLNLREESVVHRNRGDAGARDSRSPYYRERYASLPARGRDRSYSRSPIHMRRVSPPPQSRARYSRSPSPLRRRYSPSPPPLRRYSRSPIRRRRSPSPPPLRRYSRSPMRRGRSPSPLPRYSRSPPPIRRGFSPPMMRRGRSPSTPPMRRGRSPSTMHMRRRSSLSPPPMRRGRSPSPRRGRSPSPPLRRGRSPSPPPMRRGYDTSHKYR